MHTDPSLPALAALLTHASQRSQLKLSAAAAAMSTAALQRLRQGQGRCQQQLLSLMQWHQGQQAAGAAQQSRGLADQAAANSFAKARKEFEGSLSELRKQWVQERLEKEAAKAAAEEAAR